MKWYDVDPALGRAVRFGKLIHGIVKRRRKRKGKGLQQELPLREDSMDTRLIKPLAEYRTSTKSGAAGLVPLIGMGLSLIPFYDEVNAFVMQACESEQGPIMFIVGGAVVWVTSFVAARRSKTQPNPSVL